MSGARRCARPWAVLAAALVAALVLPALAPGQAVREWGTVSLRNGRLALDVAGAPLDAVLREIAAQAAFELELRGDLSMPITLRVAGLPLAAALRRLVRGHSSSVAYARGPDGRDIIQRVMVVAWVPEPVQLRHRTQRLATIRNFLRLPRQRAVPGIGSLLRNDSDPVVRARSAAALGNLGGRQAVAALTAALRDPVSLVRIRVVRELARVSGAGAVDSLVGQLAVEPDAGVRREIVSALGRLAPTGELREALATAARDDAHPVVRRTAAAALERWGRE